MRVRLRRFRGWLGCVTLDLTKRLLQADKPSDGPDFDTCVECGATGCEDGTAEHDPDCPLVTGIFVMGLRDLWPGGPTLCGDCGEEIPVGGSYTWRVDDPEHPEVRLVVCVGCAASAEILSR